MVPPPATNAHALALAPNSIVGTSTSMPEVDQLTDVANSLTMKESSPSLVSTKRAWDEDQ